MLKRNNCAQVGEAITSSGTFLHMHTVSCCTVFYCSLYLQQAMPSALPKVLNAVKWNNHKDVAVVSLNLYVPLCHCMCQLCLYNQDMWQKYIADQNSGRSKKLKYVQRNM